MGFVLTGLNSSIVSYRIVSYMMFSYNYRGSFVEDSDDLITVSAVRSVRRGEGRPPVSH